MSASGGGFSLGMPTNTGTPVLGSAATGLGTNPTTQASGFTGFNFPATSSTGFSSTPGTSTTATTAPTLSFSVNPTTTASATTSSSTSFNPLLPAAAASTSKHVTFSFPSSTTATASTTKSSTVSLTNPLTSSSIASTSSTDSGDRPINYLQLKDLTHKWFADFGDLQKSLMNQTVEIVNRDVTLTANHDKIEQFVNSIRNLKTEQTQVDQQLDFILSQQKDLEDALSTLEDEVSSYYPELSADDMFKLAENIDSRLKKTLETSKEIITKINDKNRSSENVTNPMVAIGRILNHHTNSIHMLENSTTEAQAKLNDLLKLYQQYA
ncbi:nuclear pore glycoprotein p62 [Planococcus citri]|uniref:nuclear pore glycoprotein p62 n=1 Tax=Planococcus citri TaxID=170843 RepID=UPI0031F913F8